MRLVVLLFLSLMASYASAQVGALQTECKLGGPIGKRGYQFVATCAGRAVSPDGRFAIVQHAYTTIQRPIELQEAHGRVIAKIQALTDDMPFAVFWSPNSRWFAVNHHVGSFQERPEIYEITGTRVIAHGGIRREARRKAIRISPCLHKVKWDFVHGDVIGWSRDGRKVAWYFETDTDACMGPRELGPVPKSEQWKAFWMITDAATGAIVPGSIRIIPDDRSDYYPPDKLYAEYRHAILEDRRFTSQ